MMIKEKDISIEYVSQHIHVVGSVIREDKKDHWYEIELENDCSERIFSIKAQLRFYNKSGEFIGFEEDTHEAFLEPYRRVALAIFAIPPKETSQIRLTIDATAEEKDSDKKDTLLALGFLVVLTGAAAIYSYFFR